MSEEEDVGVGHRRVRQGECLQPTDEFLTYNGMWKKTTPEPGTLVGLHVSGGIVYRRKKEPDEVAGETILEEAERLVNGTRQSEYGSPLVNHTITAQMWGAYLKIPITPRDVCLLNVLQKVSRAAASAKRDTIVDIAGWVRNIELMYPDKKE